jgi:hypothetical protein
VLWFPIRIPAWFYLGGWFLYQFFESNYSLVHRQAGGSGVAFFAHVGGFVFGVVVASILVGTGRVTAQQERSTATQVHSSQNPHSIQWFLTPAQILDRDRNGVGGTGHGYLPATCRKQP